MAIIVGRNIRGIKQAKKTREMQRLSVARQNADASYRERVSGRAAQARASSLRAEGQNRAAALNAAYASASANRLLSEFQRTRSERKSLRRRQIDQALGASKASFAASGVESVGAQREIARQSAIKGNIQVTQENSQREQILNRARSAITNAYATGVSASSAAAASRIRGNIEKRATVSAIGALGEKDFIAVGTGPDAGSRAVNRLNSRTF